MNPRAHHRDGQPAATYVIHVCPSADGYRASVREADSDQLDRRAVRAGAAGHGTAATAAAAILAALIAARIPALTGGPRQPERRPKPSRQTGPSRSRRGDDAAR